MPVKRGSNLPIRSVTTDTGDLYCFLESSDELIGVGIDPRSERFAVEMIKPVYTARTSVSRTESSPIGYDSTCRAPRYLKQTLRGLTKKAC